MYPTRLNPTRLLRGTSSMTTDPWIKICGICNAEDAAVCADAGVDAIGLLLEKSTVHPSGYSNRLSVPVAQTLNRRFPPNLLPVLLLGTGEAGNPVELVRALQPGAVQLQRLAEPAAAAALRAQFPSLIILKSFNNEDQENKKLSLSDIRSYIHRYQVDAIVLDSKYGGSGTTHDWTISQELVRQMQELPVILAGGLDDQNVAAAIQQVRPFGVDVMSGVSVSAKKRNKKDPDKIRRFVVAARTTALSAAPRVVE